MSDSADRTDQVQAAAATAELYRPVPYLAAGCGRRAGEIFGLEVDALDVDSPAVTVRQQLVALAHREPCLARPRPRRANA